MENLLFLVLFYISVLLYCFISRNKHILWRFLGKLFYTRLSRDRYGEAMERIVELVKAYEVGKPDSLVVVIPKEVRELLKISKGHKFHVKVDERGRIIYEPIK